MVQDWFGYSAPSFPGDGLVAPVLGTLVYLYGGWVLRAPPTRSAAAARDDAVDRDGDHSRVRRELGHLARNFGLDFWWSSPPSL